MVWDEVAKTGARPSDALAEKVDQFAKGLAGLLDVPSRSQCR